MVHVITNVGYDAVNNGSKTLLSCMCDCGKIIKAKSSDMYDANKISQRIEQSANIRKQLDVDILEINNKIIKSAEARKQIK